MKWRLKNDQEAQAELIFEKQNELEKLTKVKKMKMKINKNQRIKGGSYYNRCRGLLKSTLKLKFQENQKIQKK